NVAPRDPLPNTVLEQSKASPCIRQRRRVAGGFAARPPACRVLPSGEVAPGLRSSTPDPLGGLTVRLIAAEAELDVVVPGALEGETGNRRLAQVCLRRIPCAPLLGLAHGAACGYARRAVQLHGSAAGLDAF